MTKLSSTCHNEHLLDRAAMLAMRGILALQPEAKFGPDARPAFDTLMERTPAADDVEYVQAEVGGVAGWWCRPDRAIPGVAILYLHGGAYVAGSATAYRHFVGQIAARTGIATFIADYGLAPERPFPAAVHDAQSAYRGMADAGYRRIALAGDSAGGGLTLVLLAEATAQAREGRYPRPLGAVAMSPWADLTLSGASMETRASADPLLSQATLDAAASLYVGAADRGDPLISPIFGDLSGLPPVCLHVGKDEILLDDARRYAERLAAAGGYAELNVWKGMVHVFPANVAMLRGAVEALDDVGRFLRALLGLKCVRPTRPRDNMSPNPNLS